MLLSVEHLKLCLKDKATPLVSDVSLQIRHDEVLALIGESGSGKSIVAMSALRLLPPGIYIGGGRIAFDGADLTNPSPKQLRNLRGKDVGIVFQDPMTSLNPSKRCGEQVSENLLAHRLTGRKTAKIKTLELFEKVRLPSPETTFYKYPHQLSGGQKQRVMIAMAMICSPKLLIADEPTTALDAVIKKEIVALLSQLKRETKMGLLFISHDLSLVSGFADRVAIMKSGELVEQGAVSEVFDTPAHPYTKALVATHSAFKKSLKRLPTIEDVQTFDFEKNTASHQYVSEKRKALYFNKPPLLSAKGLEKIYTVKSPFKKPTVLHAVRNLSFDIYEGETIGLIGGSGCGKSTLGNLLVQLTRPTAGDLFYGGEPIIAVNGRRKKSLCRDIQMIFQDPYASLNPMMSVGNAIVEPMKAHGLHGSDRARKAKGLELLEQVGLGESFFHRKPAELSGGQRQRIGIARALSLTPKLIVCDEVVSALDVSSQAKTLNLLNDLKDAFGLTYIFISHDLSVVRHISNRIFVMNDGQIVEAGYPDQICSNPQSPYTKSLVGTLSL